MGIMENGRLTPRAGDLTLFTGKGKGVIPCWIKALLIRLDQVLSQMGNPAAPASPGIRILQRQRICRLPRRCGQFSAVTGNCEISPRLKREKFRLLITLDALRRMMEQTRPARLGVGKAGPWMKTKTILTLRADHAAAEMRFFDDVDEEVLNPRPVSVTKKCRDKRFLTRPDYGRDFDEESIAAIKQSASRTRRCRLS